MNASPACGRGELQAAASFFFFAFAYPRLEVFDLSFFTRACIALIVYTSAFVCEVVRSGVNTVPVGQAEASRALGFTFSQT